MLADAHFRAESAHAVGVLVAGLFAEAGVDRVELIVPLRAPRLLETRGTDLPGMIAAAPAGTRIAGRGTLVELFGAEVRCTTSDPVFAEILGVAAGRGLSSTRHMSQSTPQSKHGSRLTTAGVTVEVDPWYMPERSDPDREIFVFGYAVRILNERKEPVQLKDRRWLVVDAQGDENVVKGEGVVGQQPKLGTGQWFEYSSFCPLKTRWGTMEGAYTFEVEGGEPVEVQIGRFFLVAE